MLKKSSFWFVGAMFALVACNTAPKSYTLTGTVSGVADGTIVEIIPTATHQDEKPIAVVEIQGGKFTVTGSVEQPILCIMHIDNGYESFMLENANIEVKAELNDRGYYTNVDFSGSEYTDIYEQKMAFRGELNKKHAAYNNAYSEAIEAAKAETDKVKAAKMQEEAYKVLEKAETDFFNEVSVTMMKNFCANGSDFWGPLLVLNNMNYFVEGDTTMINLYDSFSDEAKNSYYGQILKRELFPPTLVGKPLPDMTGVDKNGVQQSLKELCKGKKYVVVDFWASWCGPCRKSVPALKEFYAKYASKGVEIVGVSIDKREADWKKALEEEQLPWPNILDTEAVSSTLFLVRAVPTMYVVDENGIVQSKDFYNADERAKWCEIFDKL